MNRALLLLLGIAIGILTTTLLDWGRDEVPASHAPLDDDDEEAPARIERNGSSVRVTLDASEIALAGIDSRELERVTVRPESARQGRVVQGADLLTLLRDLRSARATAAAGRAVAMTLETRVARLRRLADAGEITVARELAALEVEYRRELEAAAVREARVAQLHTALLARWGDAIATLAGKRDGPLAAIESGEALLVEFPADAEPPPTVYVAAGDVRDDAVEAKVLGPGAASLGGARGASWLASLRSPRLRAGMPVTVWLSGAEPAVEGTWLPASAVVWHRGSPWYYVAEDDTHFSRHALGEALPHRDGYVLRATPAPSWKVVVRGAPLLLAEEFRETIPEEDDD